MVRAIKTMFAKQVALPVYRHALKRFEGRTAQAQDIQNQILMDHVARSAHTRYGRDHDLPSVTTVEDFKRNVPVSRYSDLAPYITAVSEGRTDALFPADEEILCFSATTGTTGDPKIVPVTRRWLAGYQRGWKLWGAKIFLDHPQLFDGIKSLQITGPGNLGSTPLGLTIGMASALTTRFQNPLMKSYFPVPLEVGDIIDPTARNYTILRITMPEPIGFMATITPSNLIRLAQIGNRHAQSLIRDIHDGKINTRYTEKGVLPESTVRKLSKKQPRRAKALEAILNETGTLYPKDYWPVSLIACWFAGTVGYQARNLEKYYGDVARRDLGLVSTEGRHTIPLHDDTAVGILSFASGSYYEFVPVSEPDAPNRTVLDGSQLSKGARYRMLITSQNGLWRYDLGDIVRCKGHVGTAPLLEFLSKTKHVSDMEGEKLSGDQIARAVHQASEAVDQHIEYATFIPIRPPEGAPYYGVIVEEQNLDREPDRDHFLQIVDRSLVEQNVMYAGKRNDQFIGKPRVVHIATGSWARLIAKQSAKRRTGETQYKHPPLATDPEWVSDLNSVFNLGLPPQNVSD